MKKIDSLNLIPFIDIVLVLLVIVLTSASFISQNKLEVEIPQVSETSAEMGRNASEKVISITKNGELFLDENKMSLGEIELLLSRMDKNLAIVINGDKSSDFNSFVGVMNMLSKLGFKNLAILLKED